MTADADIDLAALLAQPEWASRISVERIPAVLCQLSTLQGRLASRLLPGDVAPFSRPDGEVNLPEPQANTTADSTSQTNPTDCYLSARELAQRIAYAERTIRNFTSAGVLRKGHHYFKVRGRIMYRWAAIKAWVEEEREAVTALPLVRSKRRGH